MSNTQAKEAVQIPDHVPPELVRYAGVMESEEFLADPYEFLPAMHDNFPPIFFEPSSSNPSWILTKYEDAFAMLRGYDTFTSKDMVPWPRDGEDYFRFIPAEIDPPDHRKYRQIVDPLLTPKAMMALQDNIRALANQLIDDFIDRGECDFTKEYGRPLPVSVFLDLMGLPQDMRDTFVGWAMDLLHSQNPERIGKATMEWSAYLEQVIQEKARNPDDKIISTVVHAKVDGEPLAPKEIFGFNMFLFIAGLDTVFATFNNIFLWLARNPERRREVIELINQGPAELDAVSEELLRVFSVTFAGRRLKKDHEMRGVKMKKGDRVFAVLPAANYDADAFENPREVNFHRRRKANLAFAGGVHSCMGSHLARIELKVTLVEFLRRIPDFQLKEGTRIEYWPGGVIGPKSLPLVWK